MDIFMNQLAAHGYEGQSVLTDSSEFGLPARRRRLYIFLVRVDGNPLLCFQDRSVDSIFTTFGGLLGGCTRTGPCASSILLTDEDAAVLAELRFGQKRRAELSQNQPDKPVAGDWADQHMKMAQSMNVRWGVAPPTELASNPWFATLTEREKDALPLLQAHLPKTLMRDLSQSLGRANAATWKPEIGKHISPTMLPKMNVWVEPAGHVKKARMLLGREGLLYQGFPAIQFLEVLEDLQKQAQAAGQVVGASLLPAQPKGGPKKLKQSTTKAAEPPRARDMLLTWKPSEALMQDLAGNAMALPVVMTMLQCAFASVSWHSRGTAAAPASTEQAWNGSAKISASKSKVQNLSQCPLEVFEVAASVTLCISF